MPAAAPGTWSYQRLVTYQGEDVDMDQLHSLARRDCGFAAGEFPSPEKIMKRCKAKGMEIRATKGMEKQTVTYAARTENMEKSVWAALSFEEKLAESRRLGFEPNVEPSQPDALGSVQATPPLPPPAPPPSSPPTTPQLWWRRETVEASRRAPSPTLLPAVGETATGWQWLTRPTGAASLTAGLAMVILIGLFAQRGQPTPARKTRRKARKKRDKAQAWNADAVPSARTPPQGVPAPMPTTAAPATSAPEAASAHTSAPAAASVDTSAPEAATQVASLADPPLGEQLPMMRWWWRQMGLWAVAVYFGAGALSLHAAHTMDCFHTPGMSFAVGCFAWGITRLLMSVSSRVEAVLSHIGLVKLHAVNCVACVLLFGILLRNGMRSAPAGWLGFCPPSFYEDAAALEHVVINNFHAVSVFKGMIGHIMAVELYPLLDADAICAGRGTPVALVGGLRLLAPMILFDAIFIASAYHVHPSYPSLLLTSVAGLGAWLLSFLGTIGCLRWRWRRVILELYFKARVDDASAEDEEAHPDDEDAALCVVCLQLERTHLIFPCGHQCLCKTCAEATVGKPCPLCRATCAGVCKVFK
jgi:hypothetical protein